MYMYYHTQGDVNASILILLASSWMCSSGLGWSSDDEAKIILAEKSLVSTGWRITQKTQAMMVSRTATGLWWRCIRRG